MRDVNLGLNRGKAVPIDLYSLLLVLVPFFSAAAVANRIALTLRKKRETLDSGNMAK